MSNDTSESGAAGNIATAPETHQPPAAPPPPQKPRRKRPGAMVRMVVVALSGLMTLGLLAGIAVLLLVQALQAPGPSTSPTTIVVARGAGTQSIARQLVAAGVIDRDWLFVVASRLFDRKAPLRAGEFALPAGISTRGALDLLRFGPTVVRRFTLVEGQTVQQVLRDLRAEPALVGEIDANPPEGSLLPETYHFSLGDSRASVLARMRAAMDVALAEEWAGRAEGLPISTPEQAVVLASIIEKETALADERARVASVFVNRLKRGMRLQSDPTTIYGLSGGSGELGRALLRGDLDDPSPYNTYVIAALPPAPIANPGRAALQAALHPATTDHLYFVADGSGGHAFAATLAEHNRNVAQWRRLQRQQGQNAD
jgi:UPF0755 protein